jgi:hypothetical protein
MKTYSNPAISHFTPGRGRILTVKKGEEPSIYEVILVDIDGTLTPKRVVSLECGVSCKTVGVILRDLDFPDPDFLGRGLT